MHMANEQYLQNSHKWQTWQLGFQTLDRYWASFQVTRLFHSVTNFFTQAGGVCVCTAPMHLLFCAVHTDLKATEGI